MNLANVMDEIWTVLGTVPGLRVPTGVLGVGTGAPSPYLELPEITYGEGGPGLDRIEDLGLEVLFGPISNDKVFRLALEHASTSGSKSIPAKLAAHAWVACYTLRVGSAEPTIREPRGQTAQLAYVFHLDITGAP